MVVGPVGTKKSLFKKPAWASASTATNADDDTPIFGQAHHYQEIVQAQKERREKHAIKQKEKAEKERQRTEERELKRRRISNEDSDNGIRSPRSASADSQQSQTNDVYVKDQGGEHSPDTPRTRRTRHIDRLDNSHPPQTRSQTTQRSAHEAAIALDSDDDDEIVVVNPREDQSLATARSNPPRSRPRPKQPASEPESSEEDEYLRELKNKARREARQNPLNAATEKDNTSESWTAQNETDGQFGLTIDPISPSKRTSSQDHRATSTPTTDDEPEVKIWIKSVIPNAKEVIVSRKINQPLDKVKDFWIKRNELDPALGPKIFFTWNGTRLYNSTTMRAIIERLKRTNPTHNGGDPSNGRVVIEAVTEEIFEYRQKERTARLTDPDTSLSSYADNSHEPQTNQDTLGDNHDEATTAPDPNTTKPAGIVIKLKAKGLEDMSLRVRPHTSMRKILAGFRTVRGVDAGVQSWLSYDGDRLDEDATVEEVGFEHEDTVEVYLR